MDLAKQFFVARKEIRKLFKDKLEVFSIILIVTNQFDGKRSLTHTTFMIEDCEAFRLVSRTPALLIASGGCFLRHSAVNFFIKRLPLNFPR